MPILEIISGFLGGGFLTALVFVFASSNKMTAIETNQNNMKKSIDEVKADLKCHIKETPICGFHLQCVQDISKLKNEVETLKK